MKSLMKLGVGGALLALAGMSNAALLDGKTLNDLYFSGPDKNTPVETYFNGNFVVGPGFELLPDLSIGADAALDVSDTQITLVFAASFAGGGSVGVFDRISDVFGQVRPFTSFTVNPSTTVVGFDQSRLSFDENNLFIDYTGLSYTTGQKLVFDVAAVPVPEPETYALMLAGLAAVGAVARRRKSE